MSESMPVCKMCQQRQPESHSVFECMTNFRTTLERLVKFGEAHMNKHHKGHTGFLLSAELAAASSHTSSDVDGETSDLDEAQSIEEWTSNFKTRIGAYKSLTATQIELIARACLDAVEGSPCYLTDEEWVELNALGIL